MGWNNIIKHDNNNTKLEVFFFDTSPTFCRLLIRPHLVTVAHRVSSVCQLNSIEELFFSFNEKYQAFAMLKRGTNHIDVICEASVISYQLFRHPLRASIKN